MITSFKHFTFIIIALILLGSCRKKQSEVESVVPPITPVSEIPSEYYGELSYMRFEQIIGHATFLSSTLSRAIFTAKPFVADGDLSANTLVEAGTVKLNNIVLKKNGFYQQGNQPINYYDTTGLKPTMPLTWHIEGNGPVPEFDFKLPETPPLYTGYTAIADTIVRKSAPFNIPLSGISETDKIEVWIMSGDFANLKYIRKVTMITSTSVSFSPDEMDTLGDYKGPGSLQIKLTRLFYTKIQDKYYMFPVTYVYAKNLSIMD